MGVRARISISVLNRAITITSGTVSGRIERTGSGG